MMNCIPEIRITISGILKNGDDIRIQQLLKERIRREIHTNLFVVSKLEDYSIFTIHTSIISRMVSTMRV